MSDERFTEGELFVYVNGDRWELGMVKRPNRTGDGYFCWYSTGDTAASTPTRCMHKLANHGFTKVEGLLRAATSGLTGKSTEKDRFAKSCGNCFWCEKAVPVPREDGTVYYAPDPWEFVGDDRVRAHMRARYGICKQLPDEPIATALDAQGADMPCDGDFWDVRSE